MEALRVNFCEAPTENAVIPDVKVTIPDTYIQPNIDNEMLSNLNFRVANVAELTDVIGTIESFTDSLVDDLLRIAKLNDWPFDIRNQPPCKLYIEGDPYVLSNLGFVINMEDNSCSRGLLLIFTILWDKHLRNISASNGFGETQIAADVLACVSENIRSLGIPEYGDQILWVIRVISTRVTFYKAEIPAKYLNELERGLPQRQSVKIQRWPANNNLKAGFDLTEPNGRRSVLTALAKIRSSLLHENDD
ncbi:28446_t:CDS:2 [Dentiscutata erythropus]|uniref:28446_t:CDS:1 n=1 Tax=Dentiscutata erythropus TaxID=1348616 RepID=A0A9N9BJW3_9GLOM|nr:28446_t:CDS:2 [Dentiscutata erythropus]